MIYWLVSIFTLASIVVVVGLFNHRLFSRALNGLKRQLTSAKTLKRPKLNLSLDNVRSIVATRSIAVTSSAVATKPSLTKKSSSAIPILPTLSAVAIIATVSICYLLVTHSSLAVHHVQEITASPANLQISQLLVGERLSPPPTPPEELFAELEAEIASYQATQTDAGYWPETTVLAQQKPSVMLPEPDIAALETQQATEGYSGDILATHINSGQINIKNADRNWQKMNSEFTQRLLTVYKVMSDQYGYDMVLLEGYRSPQRQARLLNKGAHVTKAGAYKSYHQFGLAGDSAFIRNGKIVITEKDPWAMQGYKLYGKVAKSAGLVWGGDWRMMDLGHVELRKKGVLGRPDMAELLTSQ